RTEWHHRCNDIGLGPGARRDDGGNDGYRQPRRDQHLIVCPWTFDGCGDRESVQRSRQRSVRLGIDRDRSGPVRRVGPPQFGGKGARLAHRRPHGRSGDEESVMHELSHSSGYAYRKTKGRIFEGLCMLAAFLGVGALIAIFVYIALKGIGALNVAFFTKTPVPVGETGGGISNAIIGTVLIVAIAAVIARSLCIAPGT